MFPVVVGQCARLFESVDMRLELLETRPFASGAVLLRYAGGSTRWRWLAAHPSAHQISRYREVSGCLARGAAHDRSGGLGCG